MRSTLTPVLLLVLCGCPEEKDEPLDTDTEAVDTEDTDLVETDVAETDDTADTEVTVDTEDTEVDPCEGALGDTAFDTDLDTDTGGCFDIGFEEVLVQCQDVPTLAVHVGDPLTAGCRTWWDVEGIRHPSLEDALDCAACDRTCVYRQDRSVMFLYCGLRSEYISWVPGGPGQLGDGEDCPTLLEFQTAQGSGFFPSRRAFEKAFPCPNDTSTDTGDTAP